MDKIKASQFADLAYYSRFRPPSRLVTFAAPASTLTNFPALVKSNSTFNIGTSTGYDVHFQDLSGNELAYELDYYDSVTGNGAWWVQIPSLSSTGPTSIKMLYGDSSVTTNGSTPATVWTDYSYVYHFSGSSPLQNSTGGAAATVDAPTSFTTSMPTGCGLRLTPTGVQYLKFIIGNVNVSIASYTIISHASQKFCHTWTTTYYSFGFDGYNNPYSIKAAGLSFTPSITFPSDVNYSAGTSGNYTNLLFNGTFYDCSAADRHDWVRQDGYHAIQVRPSIVYDVDEIRVSFSVHRSDAWFLYEQNQIVHHDQYTTYGPEA